MPFLNRLCKYCKHSLNRHLTLSVPQGVPTRFGQCLEHNCKCHHNNQRTGYAAFKEKLGL